MTRLKDLTAYLKKTDGRHARYGGGKRAARRHAKVLLRLGDMRWRLRYREDAAHFRWLKEHEEKEAADDPR